MKAKDIIDALMEVDQEKEVYLWIEGDRLEISTIDEMDNIVDINAKEEL